MNQEPGLLCRNYTHQTVGADGPLAGVSTSRPCHARTPHYWHRKLPECSPHPSARLVHRRLGSGEAEAPGICHCIIQLHRIVNTTMGLETTCHQNSLVRKSGTAMTISVMVKGAGGSPGVGLQIVEPGARTREQGVGGVQLSQTRILEVVPASGIDGTRHPLCASKKLTSPVN